MFPQCKWDCKCCCRMSCRWSFEGSLARNAFLRDSRCTKPYVFLYKVCPRTSMTAEVDHRGSGTDFVWKNIGFRASAISQKRISCETTNATTARSNLDAAITMQSAETELQKTIELRALECGNCSSKTGSRRQSEKKTILKHFLKRFLEGKSLAPKWRKSADKSLSQPSCSHSNTIYEVQLQKTIVLRMQPKQEATLQCKWDCKWRWWMSCQWNSIVICNCSILPAM